MKKNKTLNKLIILLTLLTPTIVSAEEYVAKDYIICGENKKFPTVIGTLISTIYIIIRILVPLLLVITGIISFLKVTFSGNVEDSLDKAKKKFITNIISAIVIFFIASIINFVIGLAAGKNNSITDCMYCMLHPSECKQKDSDIATLCPGLISEQYKYNSDCTLKDEYKNGEKIDYSNTGDTKVPAYSNTIASAGGGAIARTLTPNPDALTNQNLITKSYGNYNYYLYVPKIVDGSKALVVFLHGSGEVGSNISKLDGDHGFSYLIKNGMEFNCYILLPQTKSGWDDTASLKELIDYEVEHNGIDKKRINLIGFSMGANYLPQVAENIPHYFASVSAISISPQYSSIKTKPFEDVATYFFEGDNDGHSRLGKPYYDKLNSLGYNTNYKLYKNQTHFEFVTNVLKDTNFNDENNTNKTYRTFMDWVLDQRRTD